jgi:hypothetical protein
MPIALVRRALLLFIKAEIRRLRVVLRRSAMIARKNSGLVAIYAFNTHLMGLTGRRTAQTSRGFQCAP